MVIINEKRKKVKGTGINEADKWVLNANINQLICDSVKVKKLNKYNNKEEEIIKTEQELVKIEINGIKEKEILLKMIFGKQYLEMNSNKINELLSIAEKLKKNDIKELVSYTDGLAIENSLDAAWVLYDKIENNMIA